MYLVWLGLLVEALLIHAREECGVWIERFEDNSGVLERLLTQPEPDLT